MAIAAKMVNGRSFTATEMVWRPIAPLDSVHGERAELAQRRHLSGDVLS